MTRRLVAGPWVGEFGWEVMSWQGYVRKLARDYDEVIVCSDDGNDALYTDCAHTYIPHRLRGMRDCWWMRTSDQAGMLDVMHHLKSLGGDRLLPSRFIPIKHQKFISYGDRQLMPHIDVLVHARKPIGRWPGRSWPQRNWDALARRLLSQGLRMAAIGTEAFLPEGVMDFRHLRLSETMNLISASTMIAGPSSGPMPLASLCLTPQLVWSDGKRYSSIGCDNRRRFESVWNPFGTSCRVLDAYGWQPPIPILEVVILECVETWKQKSNRYFSEPLLTVGAGEL